MELYIDSHKKIESINGYKINLRNIENNEPKNKIFKKEKLPNKKLWFVNIEDMIQALCKKNMNLVSL